MKKIIKLSIISFVFLAFLTLSLKSSAVEQKSQKEIKNIIVFIGDGMGPNHVDAGGILKGSPLVFDKQDENWKYHAYSNTDSLTSAGFTLDETKSLLRPDLNKSLFDDTPSPYGNSSLGTSGNITTYTDSAAGGTAIATGTKVTNSRIGMNINGEPIENLVEIAHGLGMKTGVVTSDNIVGATPSSFLVHVGERHLEEEILNKIASSKADLICAQTVQSYENKKTTFENLYKKSGFTVTYNRNGLNNSASRLIALFPAIVTKDNDHRAPSLKELTVFALDYLDNQNGFFLMVEGSNIDKKSHSNQAGLMLRELLAFDAAVEAAVDWAEGRGDTMIVVTADHETGALYYNKDTATKDNIIDSIGWLSTNHSRTRVDIAVYGDISEFTSKYSKHFSTLEGLPYWDNTDIFRLCTYYLNK